MKKGFIFVLLGLVVLVLSVPAQSAQKKHKVAIISADAEEKMTPSPGQKEAETRLIISRSGGWLGIKMRDLTEAELKALGGDQDLGIYVVSIESSSPAEKAGIKSGDIILRWAGLPVLGLEYFSSIVSATSPGRTIQVDISRGGAKQLLKVCVGKREGERLGRYYDFENWPGGDFRFDFPSIPKIPEIRDNVMMFRSYTSRPRLGVYTEELTEQLGKYFGVPDGKGVLITSVAENSAAAKAGLQAGDVIVNVDSKKISTSQDLIESISEHKDGPLAVEVYHKGKKMEIQVQLETPKKPNRAHSI